MGKQIAVAGVKLTETDLETIWCLHEKPWTQRVPELASELGISVSAARKRLSELRGRIRLAAGSNSSVSSTAQLMRWITEHGGEINRTIGPLISDEPDMPSSGYLLAGPYEIVEADLTYRFGDASGRVPEEAIDVRRVRSLQDGLDKILIGERYTGLGSDADEAGVEYTVLEGGRLSTLEALSPEFNLLVIEFPRSLQRGETHRFRYQTKIQSSKEPIPVFSFAPPVPAQEATLRVHFGRKARPRFAWHFEGLPEMAIPGPYTSDREVHVDRFGDAAWRFHGLAVGAAYGLAWDWGSSR